jgi:hypothetical protein
VYYLYYVYHYPVRKLIAIVTGLLQLLENVQEVEITKHEKSQGGSFSSKHREHVVIAQG